MADTSERLRALKNELNAIKNSSLTDSQFIQAKKDDGNRHILQQVKKSPSP